MTDRYFVVYLVRGFVLDVVDTTSNRSRAYGLAEVLADHGQDVYVQECRREIGE